MAARKTSSKKAAAKQTAPAKARAPAKDDSPKEALPPAGNPLIQSPFSGSYDVGPCARMTGAPCPDGAEWFQDNATKRPGGPASFQVLTVDADAWRASKGL